jgi:hypothetical protein
MVYTFLWFVVCILSRCIVVVYVGLQRVSLADIDASVYCGGLDLRIDCCYSFV